MVEEFWDSINGKFIKEGGPGSGNFGHGGRPGEVGGSSSEGGASTGDRPRHLVDADVAAIMADPDISWDGKEEFGSARAISSVVDPQINNKLAYADKHRNEPIEWGSHLDENGKELLYKKGNENSVRYTASEVAVIRNCEVDMHNHPDCDHPFSSQDFKYAVAVNPAQMVVVSNNFMFTMTRPEKGWPKKMKNDGPKQLNFKPSGREAWAVWNKFAPAYRMAATREEKNKVYDKALRMNMVRACKYFGIPYRQDRI